MTTVLGHTCLVEDRQGRHQKHIHTHAPLEDLAQSSIGKNNLNLIDSQPALTVEHVKAALWQDNPAAITPACFCIFRQYLIIIDLAVVTALRRTWR